MATSNQTATLLGSTEELRIIFNKFDKNGDGKISSTELVDSLGELGTKISFKEAESVVGEFDKDGDGHIDFDEFTAFIQNGGLDVGDSADPSQCGLKDAFDLYDIDKNGLITAAELHQVLKMLGMKHSMSECANMILQVDEDGDGCVNFQEFKKMMTKGSV